MADDELSIRSDTKGFEQLAAAAEQAAGAVGKIGAQAQQAAGQAQKLADQVARANAPISRQEFGAALGLPIAGGAPVPLAPPPAPPQPAGAPDETRRRRNFLDLQGSRNVQLGDVIGTFSPQLGFLARLAGQSADELERIGAAGASAGEKLSALAGPALVGGIFAYVEIFRAVQRELEEIQKRLDDVLAKERELRDARLAAQTGAAFREVGAGRGVTKPEALEIRNAIDAVVRELGPEARSAAEQAGPLLLGETPERQRQIAVAVAGGALQGVETRGARGLARARRRVDRFLGGLRGAFVGQDAQTLLELEGERLAGEEQTARERLNVERERVRDVIPVPPGVFGQYDPRSIYRTFTGYDPLRQLEPFEQQEREAGQRRAQQRTREQRPLGPVSVTNIGTLMNFGSDSWHGPAGGFGALDHHYQTDVG